MIVELVDDFTSRRPMFPFKKKSKGSPLCTWLMHADAQHGMVLPAQVQAGATFWSLLTKGFEGSDFQSNDAM